MNLETFEIIDRQTNHVRKVRRTINNIRVRPNAHKRHDPVENYYDNISIAQFHSKQDLEYLSLNYRKERAAKICSSKRRLVIIMFQEEIPYFPTLREIRDELIQAQLNDLQ